MELKVRGKGCRERGYLEHQPTKREEEDARAKRGLILP